MSTIKLYLINQQPSDASGGYPITPFMSETCYKLLENYQTETCHDCYALSDAEVPHCGMTEKLRLALLNDPVLDTVYEYLILDTTIYPDPLDDSPSPGGSDSEFNYAGMRLMNLFEYPMTRTDRNPREVHRQLSNLVNLLQMHRFDLSSRRRSIEEVVNSVEYKALRALLFAMKETKAEVTTYSLSIPVKQRPFLERFVVKPIVQLVDELIAVPSTYCERRLSRPSA